jgi:cytidylate kinase
VTGANWRVWVDIFCQGVDKTFLLSKLGNPIISSTMWKNINLEQCLSHINRQWEAAGKGTSEINPAITISRMCGSGGRTVASKLADYLQPHAPYPYHWTIFDRELIKKVLEDHMLSTRLAEFLPESSKSVLREVVDKIRGKKHADATKIVEQTVETVWQLAKGGYVILVGRGGNLITAKLPNVFHVRLVGSHEVRVRRLEEVYDFDRPAAEEYLRSQDAAKKLYLKEYFGQDIDDANLYHLVVNTDRFTYGDTAKLIGDAFLNWFKPEPAAKVS